MTPADLRNLTFADLAASLSEQRRRVLAGWKQWGPCTTQRLSVQMEMSLLSIRPRTTELVQLGLVKLVDQQGHEGVYEALSDAEAEAEFARRHAELSERTECQPELKMGA